jgi:hypothetical protein
MVAASLSEERSVQRLMRQGNAQLAQYVGFGLVITVTTVTAGK